MQSRLGDDFYEQRLINEQVAQLTGRRFLIGYQNEETQYRALMNAGITYAKTWNLIPGVALSAEQMAQLTTDSAPASPWGMVWLVEQEVTLADGSMQKVLAPQLYARLQAGDLDSTGALLAGNDIKLETVTESSASGLMLDGHNYRREGETRETGTLIEATGNVRLQADRDVSARAANVISSEGALVLSAGRDIVVEAGEASTSSERASRTTKSGFLSSKTTTTRDTQSGTTAIASTLSGDSSTLFAGQDITIKGSNVVATNDTALIATRNLTIEAATDTHSEIHTSKTKQSGVFSSGGIGFTIGSKQQSTDQKTDATLAAKSTVGSTDGNVTLLAGENYRQVGSEVIAAKGDIDIAAKTVDILEARQTSRTVTETKSKQSGLTIAVTSPLISAIQTAQQMSEAASNTKDPRMQLLAAANIGLSANNAIDAVKAGQGTTIDGKANQMPVVDSAGKELPSRDANAADQVGGINVSISIGSSKSSSKSTQTSNTAAASNLTAGRDINITASGAGEQSDLLIQGSKVSAARNLTLTADDEIRLLAAANTADQKSTNKNSSASVGIGFALGGTQNGFTIQAGVSGGKGKANGNDLTWSNTQIEAGKALTLDSGGDTTLRGATAKGEQVVAKIGGDFKIESLQDTSTYDSQQKSLGASVSLCIPPFCYGAASTGSVSASGSKVNSDFASVAEQSGIRAGDGGFQVAAKGDTDLKGGAITSTQVAIDNNKNTFQTDGTLTTSDIQNKAEYTAKSASVNIGTGFSAAGALVPQGTSAGIGKDGGKASSLTLAAISGVAGNTAARTGDKETGIAKIFDAASVQKEIDAQTKITQMFGQLAPKAAADFAATQARDLRAQGNEEDAKKWDEGGAYRIALHTVIGGLAGGAQGALGAGASAAAAPLLNELQDSIAKGLKEAGARDSIASIAGQLIAGTTAAGIGAAVGGNAGAATGLNVDANNRQLHPDEKARIKQLSKGDKEMEERLTRAACYEVKCWAEYPEGSADREKAYVGIGESIVLDKELATIRKEQQTNGLFGYSLTQQAWDDFKAVPLPVIKNVGKTVGGGLAVSTGSTICGAGGAGCVIGGPLAAFGVSEATEGVTGLYKQYQGNGASGFNPMRSGFSTISPTWGDTAYDVTYLLFSGLALSATVPLKVGVAPTSTNTIFVTDGISRGKSMFGVTVPRWQNPILNPITNEVLLTNNAARLGLFYGIGSKALEIPTDIKKARGE